MTDKVDEFECVLYDRGQYKAIFNTAVGLSAFPNTRSNESTGELILGEHRYARDEEHLKSSIEYKDAQIRGEESSPSLSESELIAQRDEFDEGLDEVKKANSGQDAKFCPMS